MTSAGGVGYAAGANAHTFADAIDLGPKFQGENFYKNRAIVEEIKKLAARKNCTTSQIALAWVAAQGFIAIPGTTKASRLEENWASRDIELTEEEKQEMRRIIDVAKPHGNRYSPEHQALVGH
jgi:aryl-alcohol dehydrogenase-like predicted oxidoreductase